MSQADGSFDTGEAGQSVWDAVPGQQQAVARLRAALENPVHAYLFVGPQGSGKREALRIFAGELFASSSHNADESNRHRRLAHAEHHPDLVIVESEGAIFRGGRATAEGETEASILIREAHRSPVEADRKVIAAIGFESANDAAIGALLKTIEEPPDRTTVVLVAQSVPAAQSAIASRCVQIDFAALDDAALLDVLVRRGVQVETARQAVESAGGNMNRAFVLASDERLALRAEAWRAVPASLDGTGATATVLANNLRAMIDDALGAVTAHHEQELAAFEDEVEQYGLTSVAGRRNALKARHKRIERQSRLDELRFGLTLMARAYRDAAAVASNPQPYIDAVDAVFACTGAFAMNGNESLALVDLFWRLPNLPRPSAEG